MLPRGCGRFTRTGVITGLKIDVTNRTALLQNERARFPNQVSSGINLCLALLPTPARGNTVPSLRCNGIELQKQRRDQGRKIFVAHGSILSLLFVRSIVVIEAR